MSVNSRKLENMLSQVKLKVTISVVFVFIFFVVCYYNFNGIEMFESTINDSIRPKIQQYNQYIKALTLNIENDKDNAISQFISTISDDAKKTRHEQKIQMHPVTTSLEDGKRPSLYHGIVWPRLLNVSRGIKMMEFESRDEFWKVVPPNGSMVEIGVFDGDFSMKNIDNFREKFAQKDYPTYYAVDMSQTPKLKKRIKEWSASYPNFHFNMGRSDVAVNDFHDNSLDVVYIDACHAFECVDKDIKMWRKKLKPGGLLSGHDFCVNKRERK